MSQYFIDGCFDGFHYGHVNAIFQAKTFCDKLILGTHTNEEMQTHKNIPLFDYKERIFMLQYCKYIDIFVYNVPYVVNNDILIKYNCSHYLHGNETVLTQNNINAINIDPDKYITYETTSGISTSKLLVRIYKYFNNESIKYNNDYDYLLNIYNKMCLYNEMNYSSKKNKQLYLYHTWDLLCPLYIKHIIEIISNFVDYEIVCCVSDKICDNENNKKQEEDNIFIYTKLERAIALCGISIINKVYIVDYDELLIKDHTDHINLNDKSSKFYFNFNKKQYLNAIYNNINLYENKLNKELLL